MVRSAWMFPGQGSQYPSMGHSMAGMQSAVFELAEERSGLPLREVMAHGPSSLLRRPDYLEPATVALQIACVELLREHDLHPQAVCGYSLGEVSALYCAGCLTQQGALTFAAERGRILARHSAKGAWRSAAIRLPRPPAAVPFETTNKVHTACLNGPREFTITGEETSVIAAEALLMRHGASVSPVDIEGPWHSVLAAEAARECAGLLAGFDIAKPQIPICLSSAGDFEADPDALRASLNRSIDHPVYWSAVLDRLWSQGIRSTLEIAPGRILSGFVKNNWRDRHYLVQFLEREGGRPLNVETLRQTEAAFYQTFIPPVVKEENFWNLSI